MLLAAQTHVGQSWRMPDPRPDKTDRQVWGLAVRALRKRRGKTLYEAAQAYEPEGFTPGDPDKGISVQRWGQIEKGQFAFTPDQQQRLARAVGCKLEDLVAERARILGHQPRVSPGRGEEREPLGIVIPIFGRAEFDADGWKVKQAQISEANFNLGELMGPSIGITYLPDDTMQPKARAGAMVIFDRARRPEAERGCVVETHAGELYPRIYVSDDKSEVVVRALKAEVPERFPRDQVKGIYAVRFWGD